jgi:2-polyprenyl-3-methyl-5-hydroxy-6-metoxy-1,4-benzoquinol methylase
MDRATWLAERRAAVEADYTRDGPTYDDGYDAATPTHRHFVTRLIETCPPGGTLLDAPCGTGPYFEMVLAADRNVVGADQSVGMLAAAHMKHPDVRLEMVGLQELAFDAEFDATMTVDAMEHVPPEDWPVVLANLKRAVRPGGHLYLTVEEAEEREIEASFADIQARGLPGVRGETVADDTGGYHFYPGRERVRQWLAEAGLDIVDESDEWFAEHGYGYHHLLCVSPPGRA